MKIAFHIGYHKTATTWLQKEYLPRHHQIGAIYRTSHPQQNPLINYLISTPEQKFDAGHCRALLDEQISLVSAGGQQHVAVVSAERLSGFPLSGGFDSVYIAGRIQKVAPEARIFMVVREQADMITSVYKQMVLEGYPGSLEQMLNSKNWKMAGFNRAFYEYDAMIKEYQKRFGPEKVLALPYEMMRYTPEDFINRLCRFLDIDFVPAPEAKKVVNKALPSRSIKFLSHLNKYRKTEINPYPSIRIPNRMIDALVDTHVSMTSRDIELLSAQARRELHEYYRPSNDRLKDLIGIDFHAFK
ncbi:sulfotransferase [Pseudohalioglobus sediminis]|uniref:Sulfotransferase n=1 Tax=Pseudohalioglobus sediminis TaxID=2606449 RepID=A0A5B0WU02_9GAMM|nr:sulfotransferase [Pseudohalioglobus sediminis]KAA1189958.1 sulfotransferase [Pseudohalioglobus sediminis]